MDINSICKTQLTGTYEHSRYTPGYSDYDIKNEYFQNDVIDLRILGDIGSVCIFRFPK